MKKIGPITEFDAWRERAERRYRCISIAENHLDDRARGMQALYSMLIASDQLEEKLPSWMSDLPLDAKIALRTMERDFIDLFRQHVEQIDKASVALREHKKMKDDPAPESNYERLKRLDRLP